MTESQRVAQGMLAAHESVDVLHLGIGSFMAGPPVNGNLQARVDIHVVIDSHAGVLLETLHAAQWCCYYMADNGTMPIRGDINDLAREMTDHFLYGRVSQKASGINHT